MTAAPISGALFSIIRNIPLDQEVDLQDRQAFYPQVLEDVFDKLTMITQQQKEELDRCLKVNPSDDLPDDYLAECRDAREASETAQTAAETARTGAQTAQGQAETAQSAAETAKTGAETARDQAADYYNTMVQGVSNLDETFAMN
jgi:hypothetical protein